VVIETLVKGLEIESQFCENLLEQNKKQLAGAIEVNYL
jgi:hypothetical protein